jgi:hypothetical protein
VAYARTHGLTISSLIKAALRTYLAAQQPGVNPGVDIQPVPRPSVPPILLPVKVSRRKDWANTDRRDDGPWQRD